MQAIACVNVVLVSELKNSKATKTSTTNVQACAKTLHPYLYVDRQSLFTGFMSPKDRELFHMASSAAPLLEKYFG
jgi:hypothetical protein